MKIKVLFLDMPSEFKLNDNFIIDLLAERYEIDIVEEPDFLFYSAFGFHHFSKKYQRCVKIFLAGEPVIPNFNDCDYAIGYVNMEFGHRYFRAASVLSGITGKSISKDIQDRSDVDNRLLDRKFCNFIYSNATNGQGAALRMQFCKALMRYKRVDCPGEVLHNMTANELEQRYCVGTNGVMQVDSNLWQESKIIFQSKYKFSIAFENTKLDGFFTEKILDPFYAKSIPIYWGSEEITKEFNPKAFINCADFGCDFQRVINRVITLDQDNEQYMQMLREKPLCDNFDFENQEKLKDFLYRIVDKGLVLQRDHSILERFQPVSADFFGSNQDITKAMDDFFEIYYTNLWGLLLKIRLFAKTKVGKCLKKLYLNITKRE